MPIYRSVTPQESGQITVVRFFRDEAGQQPLQAFVLANDLVDTPEKLQEQLRSLGKLVRNSDPSLRLEAGDALPLP